MRSGIKWINGGCVYTYAAPECAFRSAGSGQADVRYVGRARRGGWTSTSCIGHESTQEERVANRMLVNDESQEEGVQALD